ncbi:zinc finger protein 528-like [Planococcus citri]|uniref:zinc finger protein 528-like n=1 Tax=Planococcus citri TaxID=170843 RepID=UPI0031F82113
MEVGMLPSQFLSVVLEETDKNNAHATNFSKNKTSIKISPLVAKNSTLVKRKLNGKFLTTPLPPKFNDGHKVTPPLAHSDCLEIKKRLPRTVLEECIVELADSSHKTPDKLNESIKDAVIIQPMFPKKPSKPVTDKKLKNGSYMRDIFNKVEAVYSDDDEPFLKPSPKQNGHSTSLPLDLDGSSSLLAYACDHCPNKYTNKGALWQHNVAAHSVEKSCECQLCGRKFYRNCSLALHMKCHSDEQNCSCKVCGKEFNRLSMLERHAKCHNAEPAAVVAAVFSCKICGKKFADEEALKHHVFTHNEKYTCEQCNVTFNTKQLLDLHFHITHKRSETPFACKLCKARFANLRELNEHAASHTYEKLRISCHHCGEVFTQRCTYKKHLQLHIGERLSCNICRIDFTQRSSLLRHYKRLHLLNDIPLSNGSGIMETPALTIITK